jgi:hypothetical protein
MGARLDRFVAAVNPAQGFLELSSQGAQPIHSSAPRILTAFSNG